MVTKLIINDDTIKELTIEDDIDGIIFSTEYCGDDTEDNFVAGMRIEANEAKLLVKVLRHYIDIISQ